jgi:hypothetical protein
MLAVFTKNISLQSISRDGTKANIPLSTRATLSRQPCHVPQPTMRSMLNYDAHYFRHPTTSSVRSLTISYQAACTYSKIAGNLRYRTALVVHQCLETESAGLIGKKGFPMAQREMNAGRAASGHPGAFIGSAKKECWRRKNCPMAIRMDPAVRRMR